MMSGDVYQLKGSPIEVVAQEFLSMAVSATPAEEFGPGELEVNRQVHQDEDMPERWLVLLTVHIKGEEVDDALPPPYTGVLVARGIYDIHEAFKGDAERLIRITGASMLYGAIREMLANYTSRGPNDIVYLPSISFYEDVETPKQISQPVKKKVAAKKTKPAKKKGVKKK